MNRTRDLARCAAICLLWSGLDAQEPQGLSLTSRIDLSHVENRIDRP